MGVRIGDSLAVGHELGSGNFYVFNWLIGDSSAATLVGTTASRSQLKPATSTAMSWSRAVAAGGAAAMAPTGGSTETFASGGACIKAPADGHALEAQLTPKGGAGGGGNGKGSQKAADCARLVGHHGICDGYNCTDLDSDNHNCGSCGHDCDSQSCWQGVCN